MAGAQDGTFTCVSYVEGTARLNSTDRDFGYECILCVRPIPAGQRVGRLRHEGRTKRWRSERRGSRRKTATTTATFETC